MKRSNFIMWVCVAMVCIAALSSCSAEELPTDVKQAISQKAQSMYLIEWKSNQVNPYMHLVVTRAGVNVIDVNHITDQSYKVELYKGDLLMIGVNYEASTPRPECYLAISRYNMIDYSSGIYNPDSLELLYELEAVTNGIGFNGFINNQGKIE